MNSVKYWLKLVELPDDRVPKAAYETVKSLDVKGVKTWTGDIRTCLFQYGFGIVWVSQQVENKTGFLRELKQRLIDCYAQDWHNTISAKERFKNYRGTQRERDTERDTETDTETETQRQRERERFRRADRERKKNRDRETGWREGERQSLRH